MDFFFTSTRRHTRLTCDWSSDVCSSDLVYQLVTGGMLSASGPQLGLAAPAELAVALAVLATRLAVQVVRWATARPPRSLTALRSEERRVGKGGRHRWGRDEWKKSGEVRL